MSGRGGRGKKLEDTSVPVPSADVFRVYKTVLSMLRNRGYAITDEQLALDKPTFDEAFVIPQTGEVIKSKLEITTEKSDDPEDKLLVCWTDGNKVGVAPIRQFAEALDARDIRRGILVVENTVSPFGKQALASMRGERYVQFFSYSELKFDITKHSMVPRHKVLSASERAALLESKGIKETQLPRILTTDPVARYYGMEKGDIVEIERPSKETGKYVTYRIVLPA
mmetsp:Transcript_7263/g.13388  ORF Transcript_7263/g.13388 Transcript_7263/m.13388 type:complete len:225 (+) Transcript_7263:486-1160(+)